MNNKKRNFIIVLLLLVTVTVLISAEVKQHCGKHFPKAENGEVKETITGTIQISESKLQLVQDSTKAVIDLIIPENLEAEMEKIESGKRYTFSGKNSRSGFVVDKFSICCENEVKTRHQVDASKCIGCRLCVKQCPEGAITMVKGKAVIDQEKCIDCGICVNGNGKFKGCPVKAIEKK